MNITPDIEEGMINAIEVSPHNPATVYIAFNRYKFDDFRPYIYKSTDYGESWKLLNEGIEENSFVRVVREDPKREGLLYAGTERGLYLSMDGGKVWKKWQHNLPIVPITDLKVHHNDLIVATQGRAFWIFDDLTPLHQFSSKLKENNVHFFDVVDKHKVLFSAMRRQGPLGENPSFSLQMKYFIRKIEENDSTELRIEIFDDSDNLIRSFSSEEKNKNKQAIKEEGKFQILNWDLDVEGYEPPEGVMTPRGSNGYMRSYSVVPGNYKVKFTYGEYEKTSSFKILTDPRKNISKEYYDNKNKLLSKIDSDIDNIYSSLVKFQSVRNQLKDLNERLGENEIYNEIVDLSKSTIELINDTELKLISPKQKTFQDVINFRNQLDNQLYDLMMTIDQNFPPLTGGEKIRYNDLHARWVLIKTGVDKVVENVDGINTLLIKKSVPYISREKK